MQHTSIVNVTDLTPFGFPRQSAPIGRKVLYVWDKAGIDFPAWYRWKQAHGLYFASLEKENMALEVTGRPSWDRSDPLNAGIQSVELVSGSAGVLVRWNR